MSSSQRSGGSGSDPSSPSSQGAVEPGAAEPEIEFSQEERDFFQLVQKRCLPGVWSKSVSMVRDHFVLLETEVDALADQPDEVRFRVRSYDKTVGARVSLWMYEEDWYCDCQDKNSVCPHVAAAVIFLKNGHWKETKARARRSGQTAEADDAEVAPYSQRSPYGQVFYIFVRNQAKIQLDRNLVYWTPEGEKRVPITDSLIAIQGGISSGRLQFPPLTAVQEDFQLDAFLNTPRRGELDRQKWISVFKILATIPRVFLDGKAIKVSPKPYSIKIGVVPEGRGFRLKQLVSETEVGEAFTNGVILSQNTLFAVELPQLNSEEVELLSGEGTLFSSQEEIRRLIVDILPRLKKRLEVEVKGGALPEIVEGRPEVDIHLDVSGDCETLSVIPTFCLRAKNGSPAATSQSCQSWLTCSPEEEKSVLRKLHTELQLTLGNRKEFRGADAIEFVRKARAWGCGRVLGKGLEVFQVVGGLVPEFDWAELTGASSQSNLGASLGFRLTHQGMGGAAPAASGSLSGLESVVEAWRENRSLISLGDGKGWATLPLDWLNRYGERVLELLEFKRRNQTLPKHFLPEVAKISMELGQDIPSGIGSLVEALNRTKVLAVPPLPGDLTGVLREYQERGVAWLAFLRDEGFGAMLADDMGLGKTLQALCVIRGKTLIVAPTSVLFSWAKQIEKFRPQTRFNVYYGVGRKLDLECDIVLTTYALLRLDRSTLGEVFWDTIVIDEAQMIKNPESQVAAAVHQLKGKFKLALSGTPLENRPEDLWSQFQFINPGLLGDLEDFKDRVSNPLGGIRTEGLRFVKEQVRPFILRRLKSEVARDLPPKTEVVLNCELSSEERDLYDSLLLSTRKEVLERLDAGEGVFAALELLLRLRQVCCHPGLLEQSRGASSSKVNLLLENLEESIDYGHRVLVFSQWTSFLDLIEAELKVRSISFSRLDGSTRDRESVVAAFQAPDGPSVMLLSLKAGGVGITLTAADHIYLMDPWWNPSVEDQATDRAHRIGQTQPVMVHRLIAKSTIEERILELQKSKKELAQALLEDTASVARALGSLNRDELIQLLS